MWFNGCMIYFIIHWIIVVLLSIWLYRTKKLAKFKLIKWSFWATIPLIILNILILSPWEGSCVKGSSECGSSIMVSAIVTGIYIYVIHASLVVIKVLSEIYKYIIKKSQKDL